MTSPIQRLFVASACLLALLSSQAPALAQSQTRNWAAQWITVPGASTDGYGVYYFRKTIDLTAVPEQMPIRVSGDNRYKLYVNGQLVSLGPARSDVTHWRYESVDIAPQLQAGTNVVAAVVWNDGPALRPVANVSLRTAFILEGETEQAAVLNTGDSWRCTTDPAYSPEAIILFTYYVAGPGEHVDMSQAVADWQLTTCDDSQWPAAQPIGGGISYGLPEQIGNTGSMPDWQLQPDPLPQMELTPQRLSTLRLAEGCTAPKGFPAQQAAITIPANTQAKLILDQGVLTNAYFTLKFSGGQGSTITPVYLESYFSQYPKKDNRDEVEGKIASMPSAPYKEMLRAWMNVDALGDMIYLGRHDVIVSSGAQGQEWTSLSWRTYRYVELNIQTQDEALVLDDVYGTFTGFPFELKASLQTSDEEMQRIFDIGWRTARLCAVDTYMDCPYYEQLQYLGDSRIQALISLYMTGDDRLVRNLLTLADISRTAEGITMSRYPEALVQVITCFSLWHIGAVHDYMMYANDPAFVRNLLPGVRQVLSYFARYQGDDGSIQDLPGWNFTDWVYVDGWDTGVALPGADGHSALMDLQLMLGYQTAADLEENLGVPALATLYREEAARLGQAIQTRYWDEGRGLYANRSERDYFSQHANLLAILTGLVEGETARSLAERILTDSTLSQASIYFKFYLHQALVKAGLGDDYMTWLGTWRDYMALGLTTWGETPDLAGTRSDCHAWGASPNVEFFRTVLGIDSAAPSFSQVRIEPHLGDIQEIGGQMPHPQGSISVAYKLSKKGRLTATITLPEGVSGQFIWQGSSHDLQGGENKLEL